MCDQRGEVEWGIDPMSEEKEMLESVDEGDGREETLGEPTAQPVRRSNRTVKPVDRLNL